jgi:hypothetical protein
MRGRILRLSNLDCLHHQSAYADPLGRFVAFHANRIPLPSISLANLDELVLALCECRLPNHSYAHSAPSVIFANKFSPVSLRRGGRWSRKDEDWVINGENNPADELCAELQSSEVCFLLFPRPSSDLRQRCFCRRPNHLRSTLSLSFFSVINRVNRTSFRHAPYFGPVRSAFTSMPASSKQATNGIRGLRR